MSPTPITIPITQTLNFVILNICLFLYLSIFSSDKYYYYSQHSSLEVNKLMNLSKALVMTRTISFHFQLFTIFYSISNRNVWLTRIARYFFSSKVRLENIRID